MDASPTQRGYTFTVSGRGESNQLVHGNSKHYGQTAMAITFGIFFLNTLGTVVIFSYGAGNGWALYHLKCVCGIVSIR